MNDGDDGGTVPAVDAAGHFDQLTPTSRRGPTGIELTLHYLPPARFRLLWDEAPHTCQAVLSTLPERAECFHAIYSGTVAAFLLTDHSVNPPVENATTCLLPGELVFTHYDANVRHGHLNQLSEVYWAYDRYARPTIPGQFIPLDSASVFARYEGPADRWQAFSDACRDTRFAGSTTVAIGTYEDAAGV